MLTVLPAEVIPLVEGRTGRVEVKASLCHVLHYVLDMDRVAVLLPGFHSCRLQQIFVVELVPLFADL